MAPSNDASIQSPNEHGASATVRPAPACRGLSRRTVLQAGAVAASGAFASMWLPRSSTVAATQPARAVSGLNAAGWAEFLGAQDLTWQSVPTSFDSAPFLGNGGLGAAVYQKSAGKLSLNLGDSRVRDHQGLAAGGALWGDARLPIGYLTLSTAGDVTDVDLRLSLYDAELTGLITTTSGILQLRAFVHAAQDLLVVSVTPVAGAEQVTWQFTPATAITPRYANHPGDRPAAYQSNPAPTLTTTTTGGQCEQNLAVGGQTVTQWTTRPGIGGGTDLLCTVAHSATDHSATSVASSAIATGASTTTAQLRASHRSWWNSFYAKSFVSIPDTRLMSFYWTQLYKVASATRADRPVMATCGPWLEPTWWPAAWWNLNVQLEYWLINGSAHPELDALTTAFTNHAANLTADTPSAYRPDSIAIGRTSQDDLGDNPPAALPGNTNAETGNFIWALHNVWLSYRHTMDESVLRNVLFPLLRKAVNYYRHFLTQDASGTYHLPKTYSPEYGDTRDCNFDLALLTWGCQTLLAAAKRLGISDSLAGTWQDILNHLVTPPQDATNGLWIGADLQLTTSHRHFSHILWFYPLFVKDPTSSAGRDLLQRTMQHWLSMPSMLQGYSYTGSGSMYATLGDGDSALAQLNSLFGGFVKPNTMYSEGGGPVIETPLSAAQTLHDMLVQSWGDTIRVFPAIPSNWADVAVADFATQGGFSVTARRTKGHTLFVAVRSKAGEPCRVIPGDLTGPLQVRRADGSTFTAWSQASDGAVVLDIAAGDEVVISAKGTSPVLSVGPVTTPDTIAWGLPPTGSAWHADLSGLFTITAASPEDSPTSANFDGAGYSYPLEELPPPGLMASGDVTWMFPDAGAGASAVVPAGQTVVVPTVNAHAVHLLAAAVGNGTSIDVVLNYTDGTSTTAKVALPDWSRPVPADGTVAVSVPFRNGTGSQTFLPSRIFHCTAAVDTSRTVSSVRLQSNSRGRIFAISVA